MIKFPDKKYDIIYADPPWQYKSKECLGKTSILNGELNTHYDTMTFADLSTLPVSTIRKDDSLLFLWVVSPMLDLGIDLMVYWGFVYSTVAFVWYKGKANPGHYTMSECELCLVGKHGRIPMPRGARNVRQFIDSPRGPHSAKPHEARVRISQMFPSQDKIELFARDAYLGYDCWGNEV